MAKKMFKIGETFQFGFVKLRVEKPDSNDLLLCEKCFFNGGCCIDKIKDAIGNCVWDRREDKTDIIFVKVDEP